MKGNDDIIKGHFASGIPHLPDSLYQVLGINKSTAIVYSLWYTKMKTKHKGQNIALIGNCCGLPKDSQSGYFN